MLPLLLSVTYMMVYMVIIPLGIVGLVHVTRTELLLIAVIVSMTGGLGAVDDYMNFYTYNYRLIHNLIYYLMVML